MNEMTEDFVAERQARVVPTGDIHEVGLDELFFSTTNAKGVIDEANETFCRIARWPREELIGKPHNVIRHPDMPGGAFKITWDLLKAGKPACAYVFNLAADGSAYWAFATIVPIGDRYLSVRQRPCNEGMQGALAQAYHQVRTFEDEARASGIRRSECARMGAEMLQKEIEGLGYADYADFQLDLVPIELATRRDMAPTPPGSAVTDPLHLSITRTAEEVEQQLAELTAGMESARAVSEQLTLISSRTQSTMAKLADALSGASQICDNWEDEKEIVVTALPAVLAKCNTLEAALIPVAAKVDEVNQTRRHFRFDVELARLQNEAIGRYVVGVANGLEDPKVSSKAITSLSNALYALVDTDLAHDIAATSALRDEIGRVAAALRVLNMVMTSWRSMVDSRNMAEPLAEYLPDIDRAMGRMGGDVAALSELVGKLVSAIEGFDVEAMQQRLTHISQESLGF